MPGGNGDTDSADGVRSGGRIVSQSDPTDNALAAIASILDQPPVIPRERERRTAEDVPATPPPVDEPPSLADPPPLEEDPPLPPEMPPPLEVSRPFEAHGYSKVGPGPMAAIRFKWTVREEHGDYYVDETIGDYSTPVVTGPMDKDAAIQFVDDRETEARRRFEQLKSEMTGRAAAANLVRKDSGEA
jgi:hypothetical protein